MIADRWDCQSLGHDWIATDEGDACIHCGCLACQGKAPPPPPPCYWEVQKANASQRVWDMIYTATSAIIATSTVMLWIVGLITLLEWMKGS